MEVEDTSASKSEVEKPSNTPDMSAHDAEAMVDSMLRDSPFPDPERANEEIPEDSGSNKLSEVAEGGKLPEGRGDKQPEDTPAGKLVAPCRKSIFLLLLM